MAEKAIDLGRVPAFVLLFHLGKMTMRPGGMELTRQMLDGLQIGERDHVVELAPGRGATTRMVLDLSPRSYTAVERDRTSQEKVQQFLRNGELGRCVLGKAQATGLEDGCASVVFGDAELSYVEFIPEEYFQLWTAEEREWASRLFHSPGFRSARARYVEISRLLDTTRPGPERSRLVKELYELER